MHAYINTHSLSLFRDLTVDEDSAIPQLVQLGLSFHLVIMAASLKVCSDGPMEVLFKYLLRTRSVINLGSKVNKTSIQLQNRVTMSHKR